MKINSFVANLKPEFGQNFLQYNVLKDLIKPDFSEEDEIRFRSELDNEILRVFTFINNEHVKLLSLVESASTEEQCETMKDEIYIFSEFIRITVIALKRILVRHDKTTGFKITEAYRRKIREKKLEIKNLQSLLSTMSAKRIESAHEASRYWIPADSLVSLKLGIVKYFSRHSHENVNPENKSVHTIYLDNSNLSLYSAALKQDPSAFLVKLTWTGLTPKEITFEMKGLNAVIRVPEAQVLDLLNGIDVWSEISWLNEDKKTYDEIRAKIVNYRLKPVLRTFYRRSTFENNKIKINIDSNVVMIREATDHEISADIHPLKAWARADISHEWPFRNLGPGEIVRLPYSVLEIEGDKRDLDWLESLLSQSRIEKVMGFSKFLHGSALLYPTIATEHPGWLGQTINKKNTSEAVCRTSDDGLTISVESELLELSSQSERRIAIPVRVEPKAFFANERTFLSWVQFAIFLGGIGTAMIGLGNVHAYLCGVMMIGVSAVFAFYALYLFHDRAQRIRVKDPGPYDDMIGPLVLVGLFVLVMIFSFVFRLPIKKTGLK